MENEEQLKRDGWQFAAISGGEHLKRTLEMYNELGIKTSLIKVKPGNCNECTRCFTLGQEELYKIYIKSNN